MLYITFNKIEGGILDMKPYLDFGVFIRIKNYNPFKNVTVAFDTLEWIQASILILSLFITNVNKICLTKKRDIHRSRLYFDKLSTNSL
jgi:hypothetical protein